MGTRSLTHVKDDDVIICTIYRQMDGYPTGHGADLKEILATTQLTNGYGVGDALPRVANGMGCLAAYLVGKLKGAEIGSIYLYPPGSSDCGEDYVYTVYDADDTVSLRCVDCDDHLLYEGPMADFDPDKAEAADAEG